tara:strand:+ start:1717 stop:1896 length:180 start_codon:yes stop_codon:yes gene_type:complete
MKKVVYVVITFFSVCCIFYLFGKNVLLCVMHGIIYMVISNVAFKYLKIENFLNKIISKN